MSFRGAITDERGFTIMELLVAMIVGTIILMATFSVLDRSFASNKAIVDRQDALQGGRRALELITRQLRSQVCLATAPSATVPIVSGSDTSITFYAYLGDATTVPSTPPANSQRDTSSGQIYPKRYTITYTPVTSTLGTITASEAQVSSFSPVTVGTTTTTTLAANVTLPNSKLFQYYGPSTSGAGAVSATALATPLAAASLAGVVQVTVAYKVLPTGITNVNSRQATSFQNAVFWRAVDPTSPSDQPCDNG